MLSFRGWTSRSTPWQALVFWVWLVGFVFSFAASDLFHTPHCAQRLVLQWAGHAASDSPQLAWQEATPVFQLDAECAACVFQVVAAVLQLSKAIILVPGAKIDFARVFRWLTASRVLKRSARGPPLSLHASVFRGY